MLPCARDAATIGQHYSRLADAFKQVFGADQMLDIEDCDSWTSEDVGQVLCAAYPSIFDGVNDIATAKREMNALAIRGVWFNPPKINRMIVSAISYAWQAGRARAAAART